VHYVGIDVGTTALKAIAIDPEGTVLARVQREYPLCTPRPGWVEQDPEEWWRAAEAALSELRSRVGPAAGIGLTGQMHGLVALDGRARPLRPAILWNDQRTAAEAEEIERLVGRRRLIELTGNRALPGFTAPKLLWLRRHEPATYSRITRIALPKDYVRLRLCGEHASDVSDASGTLLLDVADRRWSETMACALELDPAWLPPVFESPAPTGLTPDGVVVAAGGGDQAAGALGVGVDRPGPLSLVLGTSGVVFAALDGYQADPQGRVHAFCHAVPGSWHVMAVMLSAAESLRWLRSLLAPAVPYERLLAEAAEWPPGVEGLTFLPYLAGERTPHVDPGARGAYAGLSLRHNRGALVRALLEGVAFALRDCLDVVTELGMRPPLARVSGGGAQGDLWLRIIASVLELPLQRVAVGEGAAFGAALLAGVAAEGWEDVHAAVTDTLQPRETIEPVPEWIEPYREQLARYRALYPALRASGVSPDVPRPPSPADGP